MLCRYRASWADPEGKAMNTDFKCGTLKEKSSSGLCAGITATASVIAHSSQCWRNVTSLLVIQPSIVGLQVTHPRSRNGCAGLSVILAIAGELMRRSLGSNWRWAYLDRVADHRSNTIDFYLSPTRCAKAATRFLGKALKDCRDWNVLQSFIRQSPASYGLATVTLKQESRCAPALVYQ